MGDFIAWLRAQIDEDERVVAAMEREAERVRTAPIFQGHPLGWLAGVDIFVSPKRWLAEIDTKRRVLDRYECLRDSLPHDADSAAVGRWGILMNEYDLRILPALAQSYADRPGRLPEWGIASAG